MVVGAWSVLALAGTAGAGPPPVLPEDWSPSDPAVVRSVSIAVPPARGPRAARGAALTAAVRATLEGSVGAVVDLDVSPRAAARAEREGRLPEILARAGRRAEVAYVLDLLIVREGWRYKARARLIHTRTAEVWMDFTAAYYRPTKEARNRGRRIGKVTIGKLAFIIETGHEPATFEKQAVSVEEPVLPDAPPDAPPDATVAEVEPPLDESAVADPNDEVGWADPSDEVGWADPSDEVGWGDPNDAVGFAGASTSTQPIPDEPFPLSLLTTLQTDGAFWAERLGDQPVAKLRQSLDAELRYAGGPFRFVAAGHLEGDLAYRFDRGRYDPATLDAYEWRFIPGEVFGGVSLGHLDITVGRQVIVWGDSELLGLVDVGSPKDQREPGLQDLDNLRLASLATRVGFFLDEHRFEAAVVHESYFGERSPPDGPFGILPGLLAASAVDPILLEGRSFEFEDRPGRFDLAAQQYRLWWTYRGNRIDLGAYAGSMLAQEGVFRLPPPMALLTQDPVVIGYEHPRYTFFGQSGVLSLGSWLLRWELSFALDQQLNAGEPATLALESADYDLLGTAVGVVYAGFEDTRLVLEVAKRWIIVGDAPTPTFPPDRPAVAVRASRTFLRARLELTAFGIWAYRLGWLARVEAQYAIVDSVKVRAGYITFHPGRDFGFLTGLNTHDRFYLGLRWDLEVL